MAKPGLTWRETGRRLWRDAQRLRRYQRGKFGYAPLTWFLDPAWQCVLLHRLSHLMSRKGHHKAGRLFMQLNSLATGADIQAASVLGAGLLIPSPCGVNVSGKAGDNLTALALAGIGGSVRDADIGAGLGLPVLGDNVVAGQFTGIQGSIRLGNDVVVEAGAGAVVSLANGARLAPAVDPRPGVAPPAASRSAEPPTPCGHARWRQTRADFAADIERYRDVVARYAPAGQRGGRLSAALTNPLLALLAYRVSHWLLLNRHPRLARTLCRLNILLHKLTIPPDSCIGGGVFVPHLAGTMFNGRAGNGLTLYAIGICAGTENSGAADGPVIGDDVMIGGQSGVFGPVAVGNQAQLGPKTQLAEDVAEKMQVWSPMFRGSTRPRGTADDRQACAMLSATRTLPAGALWRETRRRLKQDRARLDGSSFFPASACVRLFRLSHYFHATGWKRPARWLWLVNAHLTGADIAPCCEIGGGLFIPHPAGTALHCRAGDDLTVLAASGIGTSLDAAGDFRGLDEAPQLGDGVHLSPHSGIYGAVGIGSRVRVLPGCIVSRPVADDITLVPRHLKFRRLSRSTATASPAIDETDPPPRYEAEARQAMDAET